ncbi:MAG: sigma-54-dependent transcriptional regulator [Dissulfurimicrobium sp.]|uniref:sigma-54-dependent transcriptional regulator n=1 Tax=Dissulfurimicrobium sp. TaxID=2022436 RepID=UPI003D11A636
MKESKLAAPSPGRPVVLVADDDRSLREFLEILLQKDGYDVVLAASGDEALGILKDRADVSVVLSDIRMPGMDGVALLREVKKVRPQTPVILITAFGSMDSAVSAMKEGALDYITKPFRIDEIRKVIRQAVSFNAGNKGGTVSGGAEAVGAYLPEKAPKAARCDRMLAASPAMLKIFELIPRVASSPSSVLITGESGTGKELVARAIHNLGNRAGMPFVVVNASGIPENLLESELFGHERGAFTGALAARRGLFAQADKGTIFLDEIGELSMALQAKLLRVVQEKTFTPLGGEREVRVDVRIISATNRDLEEEVMARRFREDLYFRLNVIHIHMPPLRERQEDIPILVQYFLDKYSKEQGKEVQGISSYAMEALTGYHFPGNVRELENIIERSVTLAASNLILPDSLSISRFKEGGKRDPDTKDADTLQIDPDIPDEGLDMEAFLAGIERRLLLKAIKRANGVKTEAAALLGMNFRAFRYRLAKHGL